MKRETIDANITIAYRYFADQRTIIVIQQIVMNHFRIKDQAFIDKMLLLSIDSFHADHRFGLSIVIVNNHSFCPFKVQFFPKRSVFRLQSRPASINSDLSFGSFTERVSIPVSLVLSLTQRKNTSPSVTLRWLRSCSAPGPTDRPHCSRARSCWASRSRGSCGPGRDRTARTAPGRAGFPW